MPSADFNQQPVYLGKKKVRGQNFFLRRPSNNPGHASEEHCIFPGDTPCMTLPVFSSLISFFLDLKITSVLLHDKTHSKTLSIQELCKQSMSTSSCWNVLPVSPLIQIQDSWYHGGSEKRSCVASFRTECSCS